MRKVVLIPDSFKGTMSSSEICSIMRSNIISHFPGCNVVSIPVADGGEGTVDCFLEAMGGTKVTLKVKGPFGDPVQGFYALIDNGATAVIEMAAAAGLPMVFGRENPMETSTFGVGQLMLDAVARGCKNIIVGLGGSCTNDLGCGAASACGAKFTDKSGAEFVPAGGTLDAIAGVDITGLKAKFAGVTVTAMCDIDNPLYGTSGAAYIFGPQKGAGPDMVKYLDEGLKSASAAITASLGVDVSQMPGAGAAGGMGGGMVAFFGASLKQGIEVVLDTVDFEKQAKDADMVFTGEGKIDTQSLRGKVVIGIAKRTHKIKVPLVAIVGDIGDDIDMAYTIGVTSIFSINRVAQDFSKVRHRSKSDLSLTMDNIMRFYKINRKKGD